MLSVFENVKILFSRSMRRIRTQFAEQDQVAFDSSSEGLESRMSELRHLRASMRKMASLAVNFMRHAQPSGSQQALSRMVELLPAEFASERLLKHSSRTGVPGNLCSFAAELWAQSYARQTFRKSFGHSFEQRLASKLQGRNLASLVGLKTTQIVAWQVPFHSLPLRAGVVIKPTRSNGSRGVHLVSTPENIIRVRDSFRLASFSELEKSARLYLRASSKPDTWIAEELLVGEDGKPASDLKFYAFYGKVALVLEVIRNEHGTFYKWWDDKFRPVDTGKHAASFPGLGFTEDYLRLAESASLHIPIPFLRVDFYRSVQGPIFGEFTPRPGRFHTFNPATDRRLGRCFVEARARLMADLYNGKDFRIFRNFIDSSQPERGRNKSRAAPN